MPIIKRPFTVCAYAMLFANIIIFSTDKEIFTLVLAVLCVICVFLTVKRIGYCKHLVLFILSAVMSSCILTYHYGTAVAEFTLEGNSRSISATVENIGGSSDSGYTFTVLDDCFVDNVAIDGKINAYLSIGYDTAVGDKIVFTADRLYANKNDGVFAFHSLSNKAFLTAISSSDITTVGHDKNYDLTALILRLRDGFNEKYNENLTSENAAITGALITGEQGNLSEEFSAALRISGTSHIFAVSGMHLSLWTGAFFILFKQRAKSKIIPNILASIFVVFYCIFTGMSPSVLRSGIMLLCVFTARIIRKHADTLNSLGFAVCVLLAVNPFLAGNVSFLLSVAATFALTGFAPEIFSKSKISDGKQRIIKAKARSLKEEFLLSLAVIPVTLPICTVFFGYTSVLSPISSLILTPIAEVLMITGGSAAIVPENNFISDFLLELTQFLSETVRKIILFFGNFDFTVLPLKKETVLPWFALSGVATVTAVALRKNKKQVLITVLTCVSLLIYSGVFSFINDKDETLVYIPSGENATCISILAPHSSKAVVYGCGGTYSYARKAVSFLNSNGKPRAEALIIPRNTITESGNEEMLTSLLQPQKILTSTLQEDTREIISGSLWDKAEIYSVNSSDFCASLIKINGIKIIVSTLAGSDFSTADARFQNGDILICRNSIPKSINTDNFSDIVIMTNKTYTSLPDNTITSKDNDITISIKGDTYVIDK